MNTSSLTTRREFVKPSAALSTAVMAPAILTGAATTKPGSDKTLRIGLIGCGGRGSGAADEALNADQNVVLTAMGDAFENQLQNSLHALQKSHPDKIKVTPDKCF